MYSYYLKIINQLCIPSQKKKITLIELHKLNVRVLNTQRKAKYECQQNKKKSTRIILMIRLGET